MIAGWMQLLRVVPMIVVMGTIFFLSHQTGERLALPTFPGLDKLAHFLVYGVLAVTVWLAQPPEFRLRNQSHAVLGTIIFCLLYAISDEFHQTFVAGREPHAGDILADMLGVICFSFGRLYLPNKIK